MATFGVCLFIILMQFLWKYVDEMVGKGIEMTVLMEMFFYAALSLLPMALPLAILLASLMTFGNFGERMELLAMKSAGIPLIKIMKPLIIVLLFVCAGAFYFQNNISPVSQVKLWTLVLSMKQKSPELDIPEGSFYKEIPGRNVYISHKDKKTGMMYNMMIYDYSKGFENAAVIVADSGKLKTSADKFYLVLSLYNGESFENLKFERTREINEKIPYRRESFSLREMLIEFDGNFNMADESIMQNRDISKNLPQLRHFIDSVSTQLDSTNALNTHALRNYVYREALAKEPSSVQSQSEESDTFSIVGFDNYLNNKPLTQQQQLINHARIGAESVLNDYKSRSMFQEADAASVRGHRVEWHRKFTLSVACLIFLFIGAPLGAIIRKGGLGMPTVISVFLFLFYYVIDIFGVKLAKQGVVPAWQGMWLSSVILLGLGSFLTYKAVNDSVMFNADAWIGFFRKLTGKKESRYYQKKDVIMSPPDYTNDLNLLESLSQRIRNYLNRNQKAPGYFAFRKAPPADAELNGIITQLETVIEDLRNSDQNLIIGKLMDYPIITNRKGFWDNPVLRWTGAVLFPIGFIFYIFTRQAHKNKNRDLLTVQRVSESLIEEIRKRIIKEEY